MTLRAFYTLCGAFTFLPAMAFLILFRPPYGSIWTRIKRTEGTRAWWVGTALRLLATAVAAGGFRILVFNIVNGDKPLVFAGWFDKLTSVFTVILAAGASTLFLMVYLAFRVWPIEDKELAENADL